MNAAKRSRFLFSLATAALFIANSIFCPAALADSPPVDSSDTECVQQLHTATISGISYYSNYTASGAYNYYDQLDSAQKGVYDALKTLKPETLELSVALKTPVTSHDPKSDQERAQTAIQRQFQPAIEALLKDYPEIFWLKFGIDGCGFSWKWEPSGNGWVIRQVTFQPAVIDAYASHDGDLQSQFNSLLASIPVYGSTRKDKIKSIHDTLAARLSYDYGFADTSFDAYGALMTGKAVCEGYSEAFKLLCDREGIPCILVVGSGTTTGVATGENHMWNAVRMEDGQWYGVDVTWDDQSKTIYDFFLVGSDTADINFGGLKFSQSHIESGNFASNIKVFTYPSLSSKAYGISSQTNTTTGGAEPTTTAKTIQIVIPSAPTTTVPVVVTAASTIVTAAPTSTSTNPASSKTNAGVAIQTSGSSTTLQDDGSKNVMEEQQTQAGAVLTEATHRDDPSSDESAVDAITLPGHSSSLGLILGIAGMVVLAAAGVAALLWLKNKKEYDEKTLTSGDHPHWQ